MLVNLGTCYRNLPALVALGLFTCLSASADAQEIRNYNANFTTNTIVADGVISPGEWDGADSSAGDWRELRNDFSDVDTDNNRFQILWDAENLYILYETDYDIAGGWLSNLGGTRPDVLFAEENLNLYIDPNRDGDLNTDNDGNPIDPSAASNQNVDGYQFAFNQYEGLAISTAADFQGVGFFTEAHVNSPFGDQGQWNNGDPAVSGGGIFHSDGITVAQNYTNSGGNGAGGLAEIVIPFSDLDALEDVPRGAGNADVDADADVDGTDYLIAQVDGNTVVDPAEGPEAAVARWLGQYPRPDSFESGLNATDGGDRTGPENGEVWGFNMSMITRENPGNFLPIWNWHSSGSFASWPHGTLTFVTPAVSAGSVPEPGCAMLAASALLISFARRRR